MHSMLLVCIGEAPRSEGMILLIEPHLLFSWSILMNAVLLCIMEYSNMQYCISERCDDLLYTKSLYISYTTLKMYSKSKHNI